MNFVGHIYLSGGDQQIALGNFIGDHVKGKQYNLYPLGIRKGILIHREIDHFTDNHPSFIATKQLFKPLYMRYAGVVTDIAFDYILAKYFEDWHSEPLHEFSREFYRTLFKNFLILPGSVKAFVPFMVKSDRLTSYSTLSGIKKSLEIMSKYSSLPPKGQEAIKLLAENETIIGQHFTQLFCDIIVHLNQQQQIPINEHAATQIAMHRTLGG